MNPAADEISRNRELLELTQRRLHDLRKQSTTKGWSADAHVRIEAEDLVAEAERLQAEIDRLERGQAPAPEQPEQQDEHTMAVAVPPSAIDLRKLQERVEENDKNLAVSKAITAGEISAIRSDLAELKEWFRYGVMMLALLTMGVLFIGALQIYTLASR
ncbi:MAG TPA: hypothetical protein VFS21_38405 [Roseiflexaceae bacterium]|nr:hypothetical protein [Roseiflexaceae bacterium]